MNATTDTYLRALSDMMGTTVNDAVSVAIVEHYVYLTMQGMKGTIETERDRPPMQQARM